MDGTKVTCLREERMESYMVGTKTSRQMNGWHKNNWPRGGTDGELNGRHENISPKNGELNGWHENSSLKGWMAQK